MELDATTEQSVALSEAIKLIEATWESTWGRFKMNLWERDQAGNLWNQSSRPAILSDSEARQLKGVTVPKRQSDVVRMLNTHRRPPMASDDAYASSESDQIMSHFVTLAQHVCDCIIVNRGTMPICSIFRCKSRVLIGEMCVNHLYQMNRGKIGRRYRTKIQPGMYAAHRALVRLAEKAITDAAWATVSDDMVTRHFDAERALGPGADFAAIATELSLGAKAPKKRKAALTTKLREVASRFASVPERPQHYLELTAALRSFSKGI